jgi:DNA (cytosine-5)-methyltransferase 1
MRALDLFCGAGGASMGLHQAGFEVTGIDIRRQPRYPFRFLEGEALDPPVPLEDYDFIWASPPCQAYSILGHLPWLKGKTYPDLVDRVRAMLVDTGKPWCLENVPGAGLSGMTLCGQMFGLPLYRHRVFETSFFCLTPGHPPHREMIGPGRLKNDAKRGTLNSSSSTGSWGKGGTITVAGHQFKKRDGQRAMGIDWMTRPEMADAIPPAYSRYIGEAFLAQRSCHQGAFCYSPVLSD